MEPGDGLPVHLVVQVRAVRVPGQGRVGLIVDAGPDVKLVVAEGYPGRVRALVQHLTVFIPPGDPGHPHQGQGHQLVGPFEKMILQGRLVYLRDEQILVGGVGTRGPGERQIEIDRRIVKDRISFLKREIREIDRRKQREVRSRSDHFTVSLVGYTNSGKSTLMNKLTGAGRFVADRLFATLDTKTARWEFGDGHSALLSDTVGFIRDLPHHLVASFRATLEEAIHANLLLHLVDISSSEARRQMESVDEVLASLGCGKIPQITLLNKLDIADDTSMAEMLACHRPNVLRVSAVTGEGLDRLVAEVTRQMRPDSVDVTALIPHAEGKLLTEIGRLADVRARRYRADGVELDIRISPAHLSQLQGRYGKLSIVKRDGEALDESNPDGDA